MPLHSPFAPDAPSLWAINILIQVTVVSVLALSIVSVLRRSAVLRWWILGSALMLILISPVTVLLTQTNGIGLFVVTDSLPITAIASMAVPNDFERTDSDAVPDVSVSAVEKESVSGVVAFDHLRIEESIAATPSPASVSTASEAITTSAPRILNVFLLVWFVGVVWKLMRMLFGWRKLNAIRQRAEEVKQPHVAEALWDACRSLGLNETPVLLQTSDIAGPVAAGIFEPAILLPESIIAHLNAGQLREILLHETAHVAHHDQIVVIAQNAIACLFWIHPLVRIVNQRFAQAREEVCDNFVILSSTATSYSRTLLNLAEHVSTNAVLPTAVGMLDGWRLEARVAGLLKINRNTDTRLTRRSIVMVFCSFGGLLAVAGMATISVSGDEAVAQQARPTVPEMGIDEGPAEKIPKDSLRITGGAEPLSNSTLFQFAGRVIDPKQEPVAGARVFFARPNAEVLAISDSEGDFQFSCQKGLLPNNAAWGNIKLIAVADGFGIAISPILRFETSGKGMQDLEARNPNKIFNLGKPPRVLKLINDDVPIQGRIVDLEGQPVSDIAVQLRFVNQAYARFAFSSVTTNANGDFEIRGIGRDRIVRLVAKGQRTEFSVFFARTADIPAETKTTLRVSDPFSADNAPEGVHRVTYGAKLTHAVGPSVPLEGRVTDAKTGAPLENVIVSGYRLANRSAEYPAREEINAVTDEEGRYRLFGLPLGSNVVLASLEKGGRYLPRQTTYQVTDEVRVMNGDLKLTKGVTVTGRVTDAKTGEPLNGTIEYYATNDNKNYEQGSVSPSAKTNGNGSYDITVLPGEGYLTFRTQQRGYAVGAMSDAVKSKANSFNPLLPAKPVSLFPTSYNRIELVAVDSADSNTICDMALPPQPNVTVGLYDVHGKPVKGANIEEVLILPKTGFARGFNRVDLPGSTYRCQQFSPEGSTAVIARHQARNLIGRLEINSPLIIDLPIIMKNPEDAAKVKIDRVRTDGESDPRLTMKTAGKIIGRVVDEDGNPRVVRIAGHEKIFATNQDGTFEMSLVLPEFPVTASAIHRNQTQVLGTIFSDVILGPGETRDLGDIQVQRNAQ